MKLTVIYERNEHHSGGTNSWTGIEAVDYGINNLPTLKVYHLGGRAFYIDLDDVKEFRIEQEVKQ